MESKANYVLVSKTASHCDTIEIRLFKKSLYFKALEQASLIGEDLMMREEGLKFDLDSDEGQDRCKSFLGCLERIFTILVIKIAPRDYREKFSKAYKILYTGEQ
jgi:hypothetical protein